jgi:DASH complex subunit ASK1
MVITPTTSSVPDTPASISTLSDLSSLGGPSGGESRPDMPRRKSSSNQNALLQKVLMKNLVGKDGRPNLSTPATKKLSKSMNKAARSRGPEGDEEEGFFPADLPKDWNGLADLSKVALSSFDSPQKSSARQRAGRNLPSASKMRAPQSSASTKMGLPSSVSSDSLFDNSIFREGPESSKAGESYQAPAFSVYKSKLSRTPAKEAARLITRDVLQSANLRSGGDWHDAGPDSPMLDPPSVVKNWATRGYTTHFPAAPQSPETAAPGVEEQSSRRPQLLVPLAEGEDSFEAEFDDDAPLPQLNFGHLADEGDEIGGPGGLGGLGGEQREQSGNVDDWGDSFEGQSGEDDNSGFDEPAQVPLNDMHDEEGDSFSDNSRSLDDETVFGAKRGPSHHAPSGYGLDPQQQALDPNSREAHLFRLQAQNDMVTLHGGNLLESQPFEASPLAGRDVRYGL